MFMNNKCHDNCDIDNNIVLTHKHMYIINFANKAISGACWPKACMHLVYSELSFNGHMLAMHWENLHYLRT